MTEYHATIIGRPTPQGSKHAHTVRTRTGRTIAVMRESSGKHLAEWRKAITTQATQAPQRPSNAISHAVLLDATFYLLRPKSHYGTGKNERKLKPGAPEYPTNRTRGDTSKLVRALEDALVTAGWLSDDSIITDIHARKRYIDRYAYRSVERAEIIIRPLD